VLLTMEVVKMNSETYGKLKVLRLPAMAEEYSRQERLTDIDSYTFEQRLSLLVDAECDSQQNNKLERLVRNAKLSKRQARLALIHYDKKRKLDRVLINELSTNRYISRMRNIIITGAAGSGKRYLGNAFGINACQSGYRVNYVRLPDLLQEMEFAKTHKSYNNALKLYKKCSLLILDEWLLVPTNNVEQTNLLEIFEQRYRLGSTIFCSQFPIEAWHSKLGGGAIAEAILDRILPGAAHIFIDGEVSMRMKTLDLDHN